MTKHTLSDLMELWNTITGADAAETAQRVRVLRESGFLPAARTRVDASTTSDFVLGMVCALTHAKANNAMDYIVEVAESEAAVFPQLGTHRKSLRGAMEALMLLLAHNRFNIQPISLSITFFHVPSTIGESATNVASATLVIAEGGRKLVHNFLTAPKTPLPQEVYPLTTTRAIDGKVLERLATMISVPTREQLARRRLDSLAPC